MSGRCEPPAAGIVGHEHVARQRRRDARRAPRAPTRPSRRGAPGCAARSRPARRRRRRPRRRSRAARGCSSRPRCAAARSPICSAIDMKRLPMISRRTGSTAVPVARGARRSPATSLERDAGRVGVDLERRSRDRRRACWSTRARAPGLRAACRAAAPRARRRARRRRSAPSHADARAAQRLGGAGRRGAAAPGARPTPRRVGR